MINVLSLSDVFITATRHIHLSLDAINPYFSVIEYMLGWDIHVLSLPCNLFCAVCMPVH